MKHDGPRGPYGGYQQERVYRMVAERATLEHCKYHEHENPRWDPSCLWCVQDMELTAFEEAGRIDRAWRGVFAGHIPMPEESKQKLLDILVGEWDNGQVTPGSGLARILEED